MRLRVIPIALVLACSSPSANDLEVTVAIHNENMKLTDVALGSTVEGSWTLSLSLGNLASAGSDVTIRQFSLVRAADSSPLFDPIPLGAGSITSKRVEIGNTELIAYKVDAATVIPADKKASLCMAGAVQIAGVVFDGARGKDTPVRSAAFTVSGCQP